MSLPGGSDDADFAIVLRQRGCGEAAARAVDLLPAPGAQQTSLVLVLRRLAAKRHPRRPHAQQPHHAAQTGGCRQRARQRGHLELAGVRLCAT